MSKKTFFLTTGIVFLLVAIIHLKRSLFEWGVIVKDFEVPMWVSWAAVLGAGFLSYQAFVFWKKK